MTPMPFGFSRRDFLRVGGLSLAGLAFRGFSPEIAGFEDADVVRVATASWSVYAAPAFDAPITSTWYRDDLIHVYKTVTAPPATPAPGETPTPNPNPIWYRVWGGYMWRGRVQRVRTIYNTPLSIIPAAAIPGERGVLAQVTVPWTSPWRFSKAYGWEQLDWRLYYESVHWVDSVDDGPPMWAVRRALVSHLGSHRQLPVLCAGHAPAAHPSKEYAPISPDVPWEQKRIDVNLTKQTLAAYEYDAIVFKTTISSGIPSSKTNTHVGKFSIMEKLPTELMGEAKVFSDGGWLRPGRRPVDLLLHGGRPGLPRHVLA